MSSSTSSNNSSANYSSSTNTTTTTTHDTRSDSQVVKDHGYKSTYEMLVSYGFSPYKDHDGEDGWQIGKKIVAGFREMDADQARADARAAGHPYSEAGGSSGGPAAAVGGGGARR